MEKRFISPLSDTTFKYLWKEEECRKWLIKLVKYIANIDLGEYRQYDQELNTGNNKKDYRLDLLFVKGDDAVNIEMYKQYDITDSFKSHAYLFRILSYDIYSGEKYKHKTCVQINFNNGYFKDDKNMTMLSYELMDRENKYKLDDIKIIDIFLPNYRGFCYNNAKEMEAMLSLLVSDSYEEMRSVADGNKEALRIVEELEKLSEDELFGLAYDAEIVNKKMMNTKYEYGKEEGRAKGRAEDRAEGIEEGKATGRIEGVEEVAIELLKMNTDLEIIKQATKLDMEDIIKIKNKIQDNNL